MNDNTRQYPKELFDKEVIKYVEDKIDKDMIDIVDFICDTKNKKLVLELQKVMDKLVKEVG